MAPTRKGTCWLFSQSFIQHVQAHLQQRAADMEIVGMEITVSTPEAVRAVQEEITCDENKEPVVTVATTIPRYIAGPGPARLRSLLPPDNFGAVVPNKIYRSAFPSPDNLGFLESLKLKTILTLVETPYPKPNLEFVEKHGIQHVKIHIPANKEVVRVSQCEMTMALNVVLNKANHPILIHCNKGKHRTGCVVGSFRKTLGESFENIYAEYNTYAGVKARKLDEAFLEQFDIRTVLWLARRNGFVEAEKPELPMLMPELTRAKTAI